MQQAFHVVHLDLVLGVVDQRPSGASFHGRLGFKPSREGALADRVEVLGPEFEVWVRACKRVQVKGRDGQHQPHAVAVDGGERRHQVVRSQPGGGGVGFAIHDDQRFAHGLPSGRGA